MNPQQIEDYQGLLDVLACPQMKHAVGFWAANVFYVLGLFWLISWLLDLVLSRAWPVYRKASILTRYAYASKCLQLQIWTFLGQQTCFPPALENHLLFFLCRRNIITYFHEIVITTGCLIWILILVDPIIFNPAFTPDILRQLGLVALILCAMYLFELIYRLEMRWQLILHHILTIALVIMSIYKVETESTAGPPPDIKEYNVKGALILALTVRLPLLSTLSRTLI